MPGHSFNPYTMRQRNEWPVRDMTRQKQRTKKKPKNAKYKAKTKALTQLP